MATTKLNGDKTPRKQKSRNPKIEFDKLQMYFGEPYVINLENTEGIITIYQPTIGDIVKFGEKKFYSTLNIFITNTTSYRLMLWECGYDWNEISDFELFIMLYSSIDSCASKLMFGDLDWNNFKPYQKNINNKSEVVLYSKVDDIEINEEVYFHISQYLRNVFNSFPEEKITTDKIMKKWFINKDKRQLENEKEKEKMKISSNDSSMLSVISACINHPGFKYNLEQLKDIGICQFYDSVKRLQLYESTTALMKGMYSGFVSGIKPDDCNFMKEL